VNSSWSENWNNPGDGKWDQDYLPSLEMAVGRIDFARLPSSFGTGQELTLLQRYLDKDHKFRMGLSPYPINERAMTVATFDYNVDNSANQSVYERAIRSSTALFGPGRLFWGDPYFQSTESYLW